MISNEFAELYAGLTDDEFEAITPADLVPEALSAYLLESARRASSQYKAEERLRLEAKAQEPRKNLFIAPISYGLKKRVALFWVGINLAVAAAVILIPPLRHELLDYMSNYPVPHHGLRREWLPDWAIDAWGYFFFAGLAIIGSWPHHRPVKDSYVSFTTRGPGQTAIVECLRSAGRKAFVGPGGNGITVFFDKEADSEDEPIILSLGSLVSENLNAPVMAVLNHDDDVLMYWLFERGEVVDEYNSCPDFAEYADEPPSGGDAGRLTTTFGVPSKRDEVEKTLRSEDLVKAADRHKALAELLHHPWPEVSMGYRNIDQEELTSGVRVA